MEIHGNQLSRYGAMSAQLPVLAPSAQAFFVLSGTPSWSGDFGFEFPVDKDGNPRVYASLPAVIASGALVAGRGDVIYLMPGHTESISNGTAMTMSIAGVTVVGLGSGGQRAVITLSTATTATINVTAAGVAFRNVLFQANFAAIVTAFTLTTAKDFQVYDCEFRDLSSVLNFVALITTDSTSNHADGLVFKGNRVIGSGTTAGTTPIKAVGSNDRWTVNDNFISLAVLNNTSAVIAQSTTKILTNLEMGRNMVVRPNTDTATGGILITTDATTNTGIVHDNYIAAADTAAAILVTAGSIYGMINNLYIGDADASGFVLPAIGAN